MYARSITHDSESPDNLLSSAKLLMQMRLFQKKNTSAAKIFFTIFLQGRYP